jgi:hypothetical protein
MLGYFKSNTNFFWIYTSKYCIAHKRENNNRLMTIYLDLDFYFYFYTFFFKQKVIKIHFENILRKTECQNNEEKIKT